MFQNNPQLIALLEKAEQEPQSILQEDHFKIETFLGEPGEINLTLSTVYDENQLPAGLVFSFEDLSGINKVTSTFKKYVSENIVDELLKNETSMELGGVQNDVCVLFCDIRGFTSMSERMKPHEVVYLLNHYFNAMIEVVFKYNGTLDKIIGDELMVLYGVPIKTDNDAQAAVDSARDMMAALRRFNGEMQPKVPQIGNWDWCQCRPGSMRKYRLGASNELYSDWRSSESGSAFMLTCQTGRNCHFKIGDGAT